MVYVLHLLCTQQATDIPGRGHQSPTSNPESALSSDLADREGWPWPSAPKRPASNRSSLRSYQPSQSGLIWLPLQPHSPPGSMQNLPGSFQLQASIILLWLPHLLPPLIFVWGWGWGWGESVLFLSCSHFPSIQCCTWDTTALSW